MASEKLTALKVKQARNPGLLCDGGGLYLHIGPTGKKAWIFRFRRASATGKSRDMGWGSFPDVSLAEARERARECRKLLAEGKDPIEERRTLRAERLVKRATAMTLRACAKAYIAAHEAEWTNEKHRKQWEKTFLDERTPYVPVGIGALPVAAVDEAVIMRFLAPLWQANPPTANRVRGRLENVLDWATTSKYRPPGANPARWRGNLEHLLATPAKRGEDNRHPALPYPQISAFMTALRRHEGVAARALEFAILCAVRTNEVRLAGWSEIDFASRLWVIPAQRMKSDAEHHVPLSDRPIEILEGMAAIRHDEWIFPGGKTGRPIGHEAMLRVLDTLGRGDVTVHGFRSTFRDFCGDKTTFPCEIAEAALAHAIGSKAEQAYRRGSALEKRRQLMQAWARFCASPTTDGVVTRLAKAG
jgi:integrase